MSEERRKTPRSTAGKTGERYGDPVPTLKKSKKKKMSEIPKSTPSTSQTEVLQSGSKPASVARSNQSIHSDSEMKKAQIDALMEEELAKLQIDYNEKCRQVAQLKADKTRARSEQSQLESDLSKLQDGDPIREEIQSKINTHESAWIERITAIQNLEIDIQFDGDNLVAKKKLLKAKAEAAKKKIDADADVETDNLSQIEKEKSIHSWAEGTVLENKRRSSNPDEVGGILGDDQETPSSSSGEEEDDPNAVSTPMPNRNSRRRRNTQSDSMDQFTQALTGLTLAIGKNIPKSQQTPSTDKFLARQVQGRDLPAFTGRPEEWPSFYAAYKSSTKTCGYSEADNLSRLQRCLKGDALKTVQCMLINPQSVNSAIEKLEKRFGRPEMIVQSLIRRVRETPPVRSDRLDSLVEFGLAVDDLTSTIIALDCKEHMANPILLDDLVKKLPPLIQVDWIKTLKQSQKVKNLETFAEWLSSSTEAAYELCPPKPKEEAPRGRSKNSADRVMAVSEEKWKKGPGGGGKDKKCHFCSKEGHTIQDCRSFESKEIDSRYQFVREKMLCFRCLNRGHRMKECRSKAHCGVNNCMLKHHKLLHHISMSKPKKPRDQEPETPTDPSDEPEIPPHAHCTSEVQTEPKRASSVMYMMVPVHLIGPNGSIRGYAVHDNYSSLTALEERTKEELGLEGRPNPLNVKGFQATSYVPESQCVQLEIMSADKKTKFEIQHVRTVKDLDLQKQSLHHATIKKWKHLRGIQFATYEDAVPTILVGIDNAHLFKPLEVRTGKGNAPTAIRTPLGWTLVGKLDDYQKEEFSFRIDEEKEDPLHDMVKRFFTTEFLGVKQGAEKLRSKEDIRAQQILDRSIRRVSDGWETELLWKYDDINLPESKSNAMRRLMTMERKMDRDEEFAAQYQLRVQEYIEKGYARVLSEKEAKSTTNKTWYLPHFMHSNPKKPGKLRLVFDAAAKSRGKCLNDFLIQGPDKLVSLPGILLKFRQRSVGITADIREMFHRVKITKEDAKAHRFLWRGMDRTREPDTLEMMVLLFGSGCSPCCAQEVKNRNALEFKDEYPGAYKSITDNHYVDDLLQSVDDESEAKKLFHDVSEVYQKGNFLICNWLSSSKAVMESIPTELRAKSMANLDMDMDSAMERVLGLFWKPELDVFTFSLSFIKAKEEILNGTSIPTKRELLSLVMSIFDPLGFVANLTVKAKMLMQSAWASKVDWDEEIPKIAHERWREWVRELKNIPTFILPRCYSVNLVTADEIQLHVFCDGSEEAYGAVTYLRIVKNGNVEVALIMAKSNVAPVKRLTIPRMELQAALMGSRLSKFIQDQLEVKIARIIYWSDSSTVLAWIRADGRRFQQFVSTRISEILDVTISRQWQWIPTLLNPSDLLTRFKTPCDWSSDSMWITGPDFLLKDEADWPKEKDNKEKVSEELLELSKHQLFKMQDVEEFRLFDISRFSKMSRLVRATAYVFRFISILKNKKANHDPLTIEEVKKAERWWWNEIQKDSFHEEIEALEAKKPLPRKSRLSKQCLALEDGILKIRGRLENADIEPNIKRPIVLDPKHPFTLLLIDCIHWKCGHHGYERMANELRQGFYIMQLRNGVRSAKKRCKLCENLKVQPAVPEMGQLPKSRVQANTSPFYSTGLDYFGPIEVIVKRSREKRYVALFTCLSTRAIHLELTHSLSTDSCILAIRRFVGRRGCPHQIWSDNGTNFKGANNELKMCLEELNQQQIGDACTFRGIKWNFLPPLAPHMGGSWERMVRSVKVALGATLSIKNLHDEVLRTLLVEAEHTVNAHPLTHVSDDPEDPEALTPNHFLMGRSSNLQPMAEVEKDELFGRKQWKTVQFMANQFWKRWVREYLPTLLRREKWNSPAEPIKEGSIVLEVNENLRRNTWPKGIVTRTFPGKDGIIRVAEIRMANGRTYTRPVAKLCVLDTQPREKDVGSQEDINV